MTGVDQTLMVRDLARLGDREVKYTVDSIGVERLVHPRSPGRELRKRDRVARWQSRGLAALPGSWRNWALRRTAHASSIEDRLNTRLLEWRARDSTLSDEGLVAVGSALNPRLAAKVTEYDADTETQYQHATVMATLQVAGVEPVLVPDGPSKRACIAVRSGAIEQVVHALLGGLGRSWHVVGLDEPHAHARPKRLTRRQLLRLAAVDGGFRLARLTAGGPGRPVSATEVGVDVEVWREPRPSSSNREGIKLATRTPEIEDDQRLVAPRQQAWTNRLSVQEWSEAAAEKYGHLPVDPLPHLFEVTGAIDAVYTWVDGADPEWNKARAAALGSPHGVGLSPEASHAARFRSHDELRYSLRSLEMFAPWIRRVHIVTAGQVPHWLDTDHPRVNLVDHREIFADPSVLPVFNSHAIESQLHRIPGLAERYLYLNDDVFFGRPVTPELFFHGNGLAKFFLSSALIGHGPREPHDDPVTSAAKNNRHLIADVFRRTTTTIFQHTPHPQLRSVFEHMEETHPELFAAVSASKFRHPEDLSIASSLHHYYAYGMGRAVPGRLEYLYLDLGHPQAALRLRELLHAREFDAFCLNDSPNVGGDDEASGRLLQAFLSHYFPIGSSFERGARPRVKDLPVPLAMEHQPASRLDGVSSS